MLQTLGIAVLIIIVILLVMFTCALIFQGTIIATDLLIESYQLWRNKK